MSWRAWCAYADWHADAELQQLEAMMPHVAFGSLRVRQADATQGAEHIGDGSEPQVEQAGEHRGSRGVVGERSSWHSCRYI
jgi:hypothetical protein